MSAKKLDILQGAPADDVMVAARRDDALRVSESAAEQGITDAQTISIKRSDLRRRWEECSAELDQTAAK
jgi:hypothetical protein